MSPPPPPPELRRGALIGAAAGLLGRMSGLGREVVFAAAFGAGPAADAWNAAHRLPNLLRELLAEGALTQALVPAVARAEAEGGPEEARRLMGAALGALGLLLGFATALLLLLSGPLLQLIAPGLPSPTADLALDLGRILAPSLAGLSLGALLGGLHNLRGRFLGPALLPGLLNLALIAATLLGPQWQAWTGAPPISALAWANSLFSLASALWLWWGLRDLGLAPWPALRHHPALPGLARTMGIALLGVVVVQFNLLVESQLASRMGAGPLSWLGYGFRLVQIPQTVVAGSVATAGLAALAPLAARGKRAELRRVIGQALELNSLLVLLCAVGLYLWADPLIALCFERGAFGPADTAATAEVLRGYALATPGICTYRVLIPICFAIGRAGLLARVSVLAMAVKLPLALGLTDQLGLIGLPLSHAATVSVELLVLGALLWRELDLGALLGQHLRMMLPALGLGLSLWLLRPHAQGLALLPLGLLAGLLSLGLARLAGLRALSRLRPPPPPPGPR